MVKLTQRVKYAPGLLSLVRCRTEIVDAAAGEQDFVLRKADHACTLRQMGLYVRAEASGSPVTTVTGALGA